MRALSLIPAVFIAITSFVAAAPVADYSVGDYPVAEYLYSDDAVNVSTDSDDTTQPTVDMGDYSVEDHPTADYLDSDNTVYVSTDSDDTTQPIVGIISSVNTQLQSLSDQFASAVQSSDVDEINSIASQMNVIISNNAPELQNAVQEYQGGSGQAGLADPLYQPLRTLINSMRNILNNANVVLLDTMSGSYISMATLIGNIRIFFVPLNTVSKDSAINLGPTITAIAGSVNAVWGLLTGQS